MLMLQPDEEELDNASNRPVPPIMEHDPVNHPSHYLANPSQVECIEVVRHLNFNVGNAIKYLWRAGLKNETKTSPQIVHAKHVEDLKKAIWYINDEIGRLEKQNVS